MINRILEKPYLLNTVKLFTLVCFFALIFIGFTAYSSDTLFLKYLRNFNLSTLFVWSFWWPLIIVFSVFFGRVWCMICPMELITSLFSRIGLKNKRPIFIQQGWLITIFYAIILFVGISGFAIHRNPTYLSIYLLILFLVAILSGLIFEKNTFCKFICPVGFLLKLYSRFSFLRLGVKRAETCSSCTNKSCIQNKLVYKTEYKSCGIGVYPAGNNTIDCILCGGCIKSCNKYKQSTEINRPNPALLKVNPLKINTLTDPLSLAESIFMLIVSGFVVYEILSEWSVTKNILMYLPSAIARFFSIENSLINGLIKSLCIFIVLPSVIWSIPFILINISKNGISLINYLTKASIALLPIMAAAHISKALLKTTSRLPYVKHILNDFSGMKNTELFLGNNISLNVLPNFTYHLLTILMLTLTFTGIAIGIRILKKQNTPNWRCFILPILYGSIFILSIVCWRLF